VTGIELVQLSKRFGSRVAVDALDFQIQPGEIFGLLGPNGAGKTTTIRMLSGLLSPSSGDAFVFGHSIRSDGEQLRGQIGLLTEQPGLYDRLTGRENLLFFIKLHCLDRRQAWARALGYLDRFGLRGREDEACGSYSKGMRQKLAIVRAILHQPQVIFFDEPTSGLDPESGRTVRDAIAELAGEGRTIVLCSHNLTEVERLCQRVAVIKGRVLALSSVQELRRVGVTLELRVGGPAIQFERALAAIPFCRSALADGNVLRVGLESEEEVPQLISLLVAQGARIYSAHRAERPLEEVYLELMREDAN
jgi:ABC-2 type transport system ATP-binding protein